MKKLSILLLTLMMYLSSFAQMYQPKREFRGAWMQCVNGAYQGKSPQQIRNMIISQLNTMQDAGINAIMFQVRPEGDALYKSNYEPWSRFLTGRQGAAPSEDWDPLEWMVEQCHQRGMECHAWINPYRAKMAGTTLCASHPASRFPDRVFWYGDLLIFNPALQENIDYTCVIAKDIVSRYDVDGLHIDDYFYPYPVAGQEIPDYAFYQSNPRGFSNIKDWRRDNVNRLVKALYTIVHKTKPWVKFGVSPFGIYRNNPQGINSPEGSATRGTTNYDDLYADIVLWDKMGWIDYNIPQIYWNVGNAAADYDVLCNWWNDNCSNRPLIIGQDVERTVQGLDPSNPQSHQMGLKYTIQRNLSNVKGSCQWYASALCNNPGGYQQYLKTLFHPYPALQPEMKFISKKKPSKPRKAKVEMLNGEWCITWDCPTSLKENNRAVQYVVYRFAPGEPVNLYDASHIVMLTQRVPNTMRKMACPIGNEDLRGYTFVVTSLNRVHNESKAAKVRL